MSTFSRVARIVNTVMTPLFSVPVIGPLLGRSMTEISYTGRKSGRRISLPVAFRRDGEETVIVGVAAPSQKTWWRNFHGDPQPISIRLDGVDRVGTGVAKVGAKGTAVIITLDPPAAA